MKKYEEKKILKMEKQKKLNKMLEKIPTTDRMRWKNETGEQGAQRAEKTGRRQETSAQKKVS